MYISGWVINSPRYRGKKIAPQNAGSATIIVNNLAITQVNGGQNVTIGVPFSVVVQAQNTNGIAASVLSDTTVALTVNTGLGSLSGNLTGTIHTGQSSATISGVIYNSTSPNFVTLTATATSGDPLNSGNSAVFHVDNPTDVYTDPAGICSGHFPCLTTIGAASAYPLAGNGNINIGAGTYAESINVAAVTRYNIVGNVTVEDVTISPSGTFDIAIGTITLTVTGDWINNGSFQDEGVDGIVNLMGSNGAQTIGGSSVTTFQNLTISNSSGVMMSQDEQVDGILALTGGDLNTGSHTLKMPIGSSTGTHDVIGSVNRQGFAGGTALSFGNPYNTIKIDSGAATAPQDITVKLTKTVPTDASTGQTNSGFPNAVTRTYIITPNGGSGFSATVQLHYLPGELNGNNEAGLNLYRFNSATGEWEIKGADARDTVNHSVTKSGITQFSPWTLSSIVPTAVDFDSATVTQTGNSNTIEWKTGFEVNNLGFNVYRDQNGQRVKINPSLIAGTALMVGARTHVEAGQGYSWQDSAADSNVSYWLEDVDLNGSSTWHGPFGVTGIPSTSRRMSRTRSVLLNNLNTSKADDSPFRSTVIQRQYPADFAAVSESVTQASVTKGRAPVRPAPLSSTLQTQWSLASQPAIKIAINKSGWYHINMLDLFAAGLNSLASPKTLQMFVSGKEIPIELNVKNPEVLSADDSIEFYGSALDTPTSDTQIYWLVSGSQQGKRISTLQSPAANNSIGATSFLYTVERKDRSLYFSALRNGDAENWFGPVVNSTAVSESLNVHHLDQSSSTQASIEIALQGVTTNSHQVNVMLNGSAIESISFDGMNHKSALLTIPQTSLIEGSNQITLTAEGAADISLIDYIRITYAHSYAADNNSLFASAASMQPVQIGGFTVNQIRAIDVANPNLPIEVEGTIAGAAGNYSISIGPAKQRDLLVFTPDQVLQPLSITANQPSSLNRGGAANYLIITSKELAFSIQPFAAFKQSQGYAVSVVDVEDIYDEFSYGVHTPQAVKDFLNWTYLHWQKQPQYVLLAGSGSLDPKNYTGLGNTDLVPVKLIDTSSMETASDDWFVDFDNDGMPQMLIGRLPVRNAPDASDLVSKIISYEQSGKANSAVLVSDISDDVDFNTPNAQLRAMIPSQMNVVSIVRGQTNTDARTELLDQLSQGGKIINYEGHGSVNLWRGNLLTSDDAQLLTNQKVSPLLVTMTCLNAYFMDPRAASLGEALVRVQNGGAVSVWASSAMTDTENQTVMDQTFFRQLFSNTNVTIGQAIRQAKAATQDNDVRRTWILFGDPTMIIRQ